VLGTVVLLSDDGGVGYSFDLPRGILLRHAHRAWSIAGGDGGLLVGEEDAVLDVVAHADPT
jgi:hypothetical protein